MRSVSNRIATAAAIRTVSNRRQFDTRRRGRGHSNQHHSLLPGAIYETKPIRRLNDNGRSAVAILAERGRGPLPVRADLAAGRRGRAAEVYFSEKADAGDPRYIDKVAPTKLWAAD